VSFGQGQVRYSISVDDAQAASKIQNVGQQFKELGNSTQSASQQMNQVPETFQTIVQEGNKVTTTTKQIQQTMQGTITTVTQSTKASQSWGDTLKNNVLSITVAASSIIGLVSQYTQLRRAQVAADKAAVAETTTQNRVIDLRNKLSATIAKYGQNSTQAAKGARDLSAAEEKASIAAQRNEVIQSSLSEKTADFAVNILPNLIGSVGSVIQVLQGFRGAEEVSTVTTIENTGAQVANAAAMKLSKTATAGVVQPLKAVAAAETQAGVAAKGMGVSIKGALIGTGIGAILVAIGTALVAFTQNWFGLRDAINAAGVELGKLFPIITPLLNVMKDLGGWMTQVLGGDVPASATKGSEALDEFGNQADDTAQDAIKAAQDIAAAWKKTIDDLIVLPGSKHKEWKEQFKKLLDLGFTKGGIHELKDKFFRPAGVAKSITDSISEAFQIVGQTKGLLSGKNLKGLSNNMIEAINEGIKKSKGQLDFMSSLVDLIKANKKNVNLPKLIADWFSGLPAELKAKLTSFGIDPNEIITKLGFDPGKLSSALNNVWKTVWGSGNSQVEATMQKGLTAWMGGGTGGAGGGTQQGWLTKIIEGIKTAFSPANLESVRQQLVAGLLAAPGNISSLIRTFIDPVLGQILNQMITFGTVMVPDWIKSTFTWANFQSALGTLKSIGTQFITGLWAILSDPTETAKQINTFVTNTVNAIGAWFAQTFPQLSKTMAGIFANAQEWFKGLVDAAIEVAKTIPSAIGAWISQKATDIQSAFNNAVSWFKGLLDAAIETAKAIPSTIGAWITQKATDAVNAALSLGSQVGAKIKEGVLSELNKEADWLSSWFKIQTAEGGGSTGGAGNAGLIHWNGPAGPSSKNPDMPTTTSQISLLNNNAISAIDTVKGEIINLGKIKVQIALMNNNAISSIQTTSGEIDNLGKLKPQISLQNQNAISAIDTTAGEIKNLGKLKPQISLQNRNAINAIQTVESEIKKLEKLKPTITVKVKYDTSNKPSGLSAGVNISSKSDSGSSKFAGGDIIIENHTHVMDMEVVRRVKAASGKNRYVFGGP
jgi:hypothetical protein